VKPTVLGIVSGVVLGVSLAMLYVGVGTGMLGCADRHQSEACEANYVRTAVSEGGVAVGTLGLVGSLIAARRARRRS
jgi:hypothetical protein